MEYLLDTADLSEIKEINDLFPIVGVTTNPTIIANENGDYKFTIHMCIIKSYINFTINIAFFVKYYLEYEVNLRIL